MKVKLTSNKDHLRMGEIYEAVTSYSPLEKHEGYIKDSIINMLLIMPDSASDGHYADAWVRSWWVPKSCLEVVEEDTSISKLKIGQRWRWKQGTEEWIAEVTDIFSSEKFALCKIVQVILGSKRVGAVAKWNFDSSYWQYLLGQDRPS